MSYFATPNSPSHERARWALHVDIYEPEGAGLGYPVVAHTFYGKTKSEAQGYCKAHLGTCEFFHDCLAEGKWNDVTCVHNTWWEKL